MLLLAQISVISKHATTWWVGMIYMTTSIAFIPISKTHQQWSHREPPSWRETHTFTTTSQFFQTRVVDELMWQVMRYKLTDLRSHSVPRLAKADSPRPVPLFDWQRSQMWSVEFVQRMTSQLGMSVQATCASRTWSQELERARWLERDKWLERARWSERNTTITTKTN